MEVALCDNFNPQRFRPNFCKTCCKTKAEHVVSPVQQVAQRASLPTPIAPDAPATVVSLSNSANFLRKPSELKKPPVHGTATQSPEPGKKLTRRISIVNRNRVSKQLKNGFVAKQQQKNEIPNANKFFITALRGLLADGIGLSQNETEDLVRRVIASNAIREDPAVPEVLLNKKKTEYLTNFIHTATDFMDEQKTLRRIIIVQSQVRRYLVTKRFDSMSSEEMDLLRKRNQIYIDLVRTEKKFVDSIDDLISRFIHKIRHSDVVAPHECAFIFSNIESVADEHRALLQRLERAGDDWPFIKNIGAIFLDIKSLLNAISVYVSNFKNAMNEIERISDENPRFKAFCDQQAAEEIDLTMSLTMPVNRIAQYEYVLRNLADHTPQGSKEREDCENAFAVLAQSSLVVQTSLVESGETARIHAVQRKLKADGPMALIKPGRKLLEEHKFKKHAVCLFNDLVVVSRLPPAKGFSTGRSTKSKQKSSSREDMNRVKKIQDLNNCDLHVSEKSLDLKVGDETFKLMPLSAVARNAFVTDFNRAVEDLNRAKVFGAALADTVKRENPPDGIPLIIKKNVEYIEEHYLTQPGIFRMAGAKREITQLRETFDRGGEDAEKIQLKDINVHSLCDIIKSYLRSLPEPLLSYAVYNPLVQLMKDQTNDKTAQIGKIKLEIETHTPKVSLVVLHYLVQFLRKVFAHSEENMMISSNLAIVFGPTFLWPKENSLESAMDMPYVNSVIQLILESPESTLPPLP